MDDKGYQTMLERLFAEEALQGVNPTQCGAGSCRYSRAWAAAAAVAAGLEAMEIASQEAWARGIEEDGSAKADPFFEKADRLLTGEEPCPACGSLAVAAA